MDEEIFVVEHFNRERWVRTWWTNNYEVVGKFGRPLKVTKAEAEKALAVAQQRFPHDQYRVSEAL